MFYSGNQQNFPDGGASSQRIKRLESGHVLTLKPGQCILKLADGTLKVTSAVVTPAITKSMDSIGCTPVAFSPDITGHVVRDEVPTVSVFSNCLIKEKQGKISIHTDSVIHCIIFFFFRATGEASVNQHCHLVLQEMSHQPLLFLRWVNSREVTLKTATIFKKR